MRIGKRLFPYPLLNNERLFSQFKTSNFSLNYDKIELIDGNYVIKNACYFCDNDKLNHLIAESKVVVVCLVECPETMFRKTYLLNKNFQDLIIPLTEINGKLTISAFAVANEDICGYSNDDFLEDYDGISFNIEKNDILAVDDGIMDKLQFEGFEDDKKTSIFLVVKDKNIEDGIMQIEYTSEKIVISLPEEQWNRYDKTKSIAGFRNLYFSIIAIPALSQAIASLKNTKENVDLLCMEYNWFNAFVNRYQEMNGIELDNDNFVGLDPYVETQKMLNASVTKSVDDIFAIAMGNNLGGEEDGD